MKVSHCCLRLVLQRYLCLLIVFSTILLSTSIESHAAKGDLWHVTYSNDTYTLTASQDDIYESSTDKGTSYKSAFYPLRQFSSATSNHLVAGNTYRVIFSGRCSFSNSSSGLVNTCQVYYMAGGQKFLIASAENNSVYSDCSFEFQYTGGETGLLFEYSFASSNSSVETTYPQFTLRKMTYGGKTGIFFLEDLGSSSAHGDLLQNINETTEHTEEIMGEVNETSKGILGSIREFFGSFFDNLIDSVIGLFVPSSDEMGDLFERLNQFFSDTFGFLYAPFEIIGLVFEALMTESDVPELLFPGFSIDGMQVWPQMYVSIENEISIEVFRYVRMVTGALLSIWFIQFLRDFFDKRFGGGGN